MHIHHINYATYYASLEASKPQDVMSLHAKETGRYKGSLQYKSKSFFLTRGVPVGQEKIYPEP